MMGFIISVVEEFLTGKGTLQQVLLPETPCCSSPIRNEAHVHSSSGPCRAQGHWRRLAVRMATSHCPYSQSQLQELS